MQSPSTIDTPENWDRASRGYADSVAPVLMEPFAPELVERLRVDAHSRVLEVGAGSGALTQTLAGRVGSLLATDFSPAMVELLRNRMQAAGLENVTCEVMDGQALGLPDGGFDAAACCFALMLFPDHVKGFSELRRVLGPGGRAVVSGWAGPDRFETFGLFLEGLRAAFPELPPPDTPPPVFSLSNLSDFKAEMEAGGFRNVEVECVSRDVELVGFEDLWAMLTSGAPPARLLLEGVGSDGADRLRDALGGIVQERFGSGPIRLTNTATVGQGDVG